MAKNHHRVVVTTTSTNVTEDDQRKIHNHEMTRFDRKAQTPWLVSHTDSLGRTRYYTRIVIDTQYVRRYGPFDFLADAVTCHEKALRMMIEYMEEDMINRLKDWDYDLRVFLENEELGQSNCVYEERDAGKGR